MSTLADRLRGIIGPPDQYGAVQRPSSLGLQRTDNLEAALGGAWRDSPGGRTFIVEQRRDASSTHGHQTIGRIAARLEEASAEAALVAGGAAARPPFIFFDLETTGLGGGAGTYAFLVGCGWFEESGAFFTRQFVLTRLGDERSLLVTVADELRRAGALVSFNGKAFDAPLLETRYQYHRLEWIGDGLPHLDVLHPARRFWREEPAGLQTPTSCSLVSLERQILGVHRTGDVPGFEIPARYFQFVRSGDATPLAAVLEHNRLDLLSLAGLTMRLLHLLRSGPMAAGNTREILALGRMYARAGLGARALSAYEQAAANASGTLRVESLRTLALALRRVRRFDEAAIVWGRLLALACCPRTVAREANEALAIHHEHRVRDLMLAKAFALDSFDDTRSALNDAVRHRLSRIEKKLSVRGGNTGRILLDPPFS